MGSVISPHTRWVLMLNASINNSSFSLQQSDCGIYNQKQLSRALHFVRKHIVYPQVFESNTEPSSVFGGQIVVAVRWSRIVQGILRRHQEDWVLYCFLALAFVLANWYLYGKSGQFSFSLPPRDSISNRESKKSWKIRKNK